MEVLTKEEHTAGSFEKLLLDMCWLANQKMNMSYIIYFGNLMNKSYLISVDGLMSAFLLSRTSTTSKLPLKQDFLSGFFTSCRMIENSSLSDNFTEYPRMGMILHLQFFCLNYFLLSPEPF